MANKEINIELLKLAAFSDEEIEQFLPDWMKAVEAVGLNDDDVRNAVEDYIPTHWDIQYLGIRKLIGAFLRELVEMTKTKQYKAEGKPIVYGILPSITLPFNAIKRASKGEAYVAFPDLLLVAILNGIFHKAGPLLQVAEEANFTYGCRHCPLNKARFAGFAKGIISAPDVIWSWGLTCDEGPKTDEMIQCMVGENWRYVISRIPHDTYFGSHEDEDEERITYLSKVLRTDMEEVYDIIGVHPTDEDLQAAINENNRVVFKAATLSNLVSSADPVPLRGFELPFFQVIFCTPFNLGYKYIEEALDITIKEVKKAVKAGEGILPKGSPKLGSYFAPYPLPWVDKMFMDNGVITCLSECIAPAARQLKPGKYTDPYMSIAESWLRMELGVNTGYEVEDMVEKVTTSKVDGMYMGLFDFDRWLGAHQKMCATLVEKETGVPHYYIEGDFWDDREYSQEAMRTRIESICQIIRMKKSEKDAENA